MVGKRYEMDNAPERIRSGYFARPATKPHYSQKRAIRYPVDAFPGVAYDASKPVWAADRAPAYGRLSLPRRGPGGVLPTQASPSQTTDRKLPDLREDGHGQVMWVSRETASDRPTIGGYHGQQRSAREEGRPLARCREVLPLGPNAHPGRAGRRQPPRRELLA